MGSKWRRKKMKKEEEEGEEEKRTRRQSLKPSKLNLGCLGIKEREL